MTRELTALVSKDRVFYTLQGEGPLMGMPSLFVRLDVCNLKCRWGDTYCDAFYTSWEPSGERVPGNQLWDEVRKALDAHPATGLVITGGEPALQPDVVRMLTRNVEERNVRLALPFHQRVRMTTLETNGTKYIADHGLTLVCLSPKLSTSTPVGSQYEKVHERNRWQPDVIRQWMQDGVEYYFKFVVDTPRDLDEVGAMLRDVNQPLDPERVCLMPQGTDSKVLWERGRWLAEECKRLGVRFAPRLQIDLWGNTPGT